MSGGKAGVGIFGQAGAIELVPRFERQGYGREQIAARRRWVEEKAGCVLPNLGALPIDGESLRGNIENLIGMAQVPVGVAGPLRVVGEAADGTFYVPLATTEGALVRSYERGMVALTRSGGVSVRVERDENRISPSFSCPDVAAAAALRDWMLDHSEEIRGEAEATTRHGRLLEIAPSMVGREVILEFVFATGDAHGMNMLTKAADRVCRWISSQGPAESYFLFSGAESEKRASGLTLSRGKGKRVVAGARLPAQVLTAVLHASAREIERLWRRTVVGHLAAGALGYNGQLANLLTALFIACGQDVANVANSAVGITQFEAIEDDALYASVTLPSLTVASVGGGTGIPTAQDCLELLHCAGEGGARKLAEIAGAAALAGELSMAGALASGEFAAAHEDYGRNYPREDETP